jgi:hypothetical protein
VLFRSDATLKDGCTPLPKVESFVVILKGNWISDPPPPDILPLTLIASDRGICVSEKVELDVADDATVF